MREILESINLRVRVAHYLADFMTENCRALRHAASSGAVLVDLYVNPDGRERGNRIAAYPTNAKLGTVRRHREQIAQLGTLAGRVAMRSSDPEADLLKVSAELDARMKRLRLLDPKLAKIFSTVGKQHLSGEEQAALDIEQFNWTSSPGNVSAATEIRNDRNAQPYTRNARTHTAHIGRSHRVTEEAIVEADMLGGGRLY